MRDFIWTGDNIGLNGGESPVIVSLMDNSGRRQYVSLEQALAVAEQIDQPSGYPRLAKTLPAAAADGHLCAVDLAAWCAAERRIETLMYDSAQDLNVAFWLVVEDRIKDGRGVIGVPLSPKFATEEQCREAAAEIKVTKPNAYLACHTIYFHWNSPQDVAERKKLLDEIHYAEVCHG
jgi:hypothetical protein